ncbi:bifunctional diaminohydroxyphosphoribosylaminopyrimidine deaminase/5-amino-6-(5-phosphoribosylamino)uracil reductase RibD [Thermonema rossianum]|uniref:bifunctional diaminohydroxyphosphoribosylaminopyrimidine deaminase/5-amino-6-(5-phosphoribosylamino)uracil reductase RibD n=1 Tax=Thermonema rossianum TaxID=55505 RepID=UPI00068EF450|nr:bifunctional diaminohydroxyphosphoribosylaminopyrimidine deaminase/5-amino-6-(5-phosphoribosylamino)uracil reductase RibD [Thermonema rossianum]
MSQHEDRVWMQRALQLATYGKGQVAPNPLVGSVVVHQGRILGEGWHQRYGEAHAEVNALRQVTNEALLRESTVYVNLEPCAHFGKTPPCARLLVEKQVRRVVVANLDPNPLVAGKGIEILRAAGIEVTTGVCQEAGYWLNRRFFTFMTQRRPYIVLKWAQSSDGYLAPLPPAPLWMTGKRSKQLVHRWRTEESAILAGKNTLLIDNPQLTARLWHGKQPLRIVIDRQGQLPPSLKVFDRQAPTLYFGPQQGAARPLPGHIEHCAIPAAEAQEHTTLLAFVLEECYRRGIQSIFVEGGKQTLETFLKMGCWDELRLFIAPCLLQHGLAAPTLPPGARLLDRQEIDGDLLLFYSNPKNPYHAQYHPSYT